MDTKNLPQVGDVIKSKKFAYGYRDYGNLNLIRVDGKTLTHPVTEVLTEDERLKTASKTGVIPPKDRNVDFGAYDKKRGTAKFVVERAVLEGGGIEMGHDQYPDGWHVNARQLNDDGSYNPDGQEITFYMSGAFNHMVLQEDIKIVGKMKRIFV